MTIPIPEYRLNEWISHLRRIVGNATCDPTDTRTANALRMAGKDLRTMEKYLSQKHKNNDLSQIYDTSG